LVVVVRRETDRQLCKAHASFKPTLCFAIRCDRNIVSQRLPLTNAAYTASDAHLSRRYNDFNTGWRASKGTISDGQQFRRGGCLLASRGIVVSARSHYRHMQDHEPNGA
jgi:hypothetical protein